MANSRQSLMVHDDEFHDGSAKRGVANGIAPLDANAKVPITNIYVPSRTIVTGSRTLNTVYQNSSNRTLLVLVSATRQAAGFCLEGYADNSNPPTTLQCRSCNAATETQQIVFMVNPGEYYKVVAIYVDTLNVWVEIQI